MRPTATSRAASARHQTAPGKPAAGGAHGIPPGLETVAGFLLNQLAQRIREQTEQALAPLGIRARQVGILLVLRDEGPRSQQALGAALSMDRTTTMQLIDALERQGVVVRQPDAADRRAYLVALTADGRRMVRTIEREVRAVEADVLSGLAADERRDLNRLLRAALAALRQRGSTTEEPPSGRRRTSPGSQGDGGSSARSASARAPRTPEREPSAGGTT